MKKFTNNQPFINTPEIKTSIPKQPNKLNTLTNIIELLPKLNISKLFEQQNTKNYTANTPNQIKPAILNFNYERTSLALEKNRQKTQNIFNNK